jgi:hypothetical protein
MIYLLGNNVRTVQEDLFNEIISISKNSNFARDYSLPSSFEDLKNIEIFKPEELSDIVQDIINEDKSKNYFSNEIIALASSSGTLGIPKLIPVTNQRIEDISKEAFLWALFNYEDMPKILKGKTLFYPAIPYKDKSKKIPIVNISGFQFINSPVYTHNNFLVPPNVWLIDDIEKRDFEIAYNTLINKNTVNPSFPSAYVAINRWKYIQENIDNLLNEMIRRGDIDRALEIKFFTNSMFIDDILPNIFRITTYLSDTNIPDINSYFKFFKNSENIKLVEAGVNLSECRATIGFPGKQNSGLPSFHTFVYMFQEFKDGNLIGERKFLHELEEGKKYNLFSFGKDMPFLWDTNDIFEVTGYYNPFLMKSQIPILNHFTKNNFINFVQEHMHLNDFSNAVVKSFKKLNVDVSSFFLTPYNKSDKKGYNIIVPDLFQDNNSLLKKIYSQLLDVLTYYETIAQHNSMAPPQLQVISKDQIENYHLKQVEINAQYKPKIVQDEKFAKNFPQDKIISLESDNLRIILDQATSKYVEKGLID